MWFSRSKWHNRWKTPTQTYAEFVLLAVACTGQRQCLGQQIGAQITFAAACNIIAHAVTIICRIRAALKLLTAKWTKKSLQKLSTFAWSTPKRCRAFWAETVCWFPRTNVGGCVHRRIYRCGDAKSILPQNSEHIHTIRKGALISLKFRTVWDPGKILRNQWQTKKLPLNSKVAPESKQTLQVLSKVERINRSLFRHDCIEIKRPLIIRALSSGRKDRTNTAIGTPMSF